MKTVFGTESPKTAVRQIIVYENLKTFQIDTSLNSYGQPLVTTHNRYTIKHTILNWYP